MIAAALVFANSAFAADVDFGSLGDHEQRFDIPPICPCGPGLSSFSFTHGLWYKVEHKKPSCLRYENIWARREDGTPLPVTIQETGTPGEAGYKLDAYVDDD